MSGILKSAAVILLALCLASCSLFREDGESRESLTLDAATVGAAVSEGELVSESVIESGAGEDDALPAAKIGLYDDLDDSGVYTRLETWDCEWVVGVDLAVFDIIPSDAEEIEHAGAYRDMWIEEAGGADVRPELLLEYVAEGREYVEKIASPSDAQRVSSGGYIEVYLYDDVHQAPGAWYSHLTEADMTEQTMITSVKLTGGANIGKAESIRLTAYLAGKAGASVSLTRAK